MKTRRATFFNDFTSSCILYLRLFEHFIHGKNTWQCSLMDIMVIDIFCVD